MTQYGGRIEIYDLVGEGDNQQINERIYDGDWLKKDYFATNNRITVTTIELTEYREMTGLLLCLYNISGELLDQEKIDFAVKVDERKISWIRWVLFVIVVLCTCYAVFKILK